MANFLYQGFIVMIERVLIPRDSRLITPLFCDNIGRSTVVIEVLATELSILFSNTRYGKPEQTAPKWLYLNQKEIFLGD